MNEQTPLLSVVVPVFDEEANVRPLVRAVEAALSDERLRWELVLVDDGSRDRTGDVAESLAREDRRIRVVRLARNYGQTAALQAGFDHARGRIVVTMDGDLQNDPADIPRLLAKLDEGYDVVSGYRERRRDPWLTRKLPSRAANALIRWITGVPIRDNGCSLKVYRREVVDRLYLYADQHRFIAPLAVSLAGARIAEIPVRHHPRLHGRSKYGLSRTVKVLADLLTVKTLRSFRDRPLALFGSAAVASATVGMLLAVAALIAVWEFQPHKARAFVLPGSAFLFLALSGYLLILGLVGEAVVRTGREAPQPPPLVHEETRP